MLLLSVLVLGVFVGVIRGGRLGALGEHPWRVPFLPFLAVAIQVVAFLPDESASAAARAFAAGLHGASYALALAFVWANRRTAGMWLIGAGLAANALVIAVNGGFMPVSPHAPGNPNTEATARGLYNNVAVMSGDTRLWFLGDVFQTPQWLWLKGAFSLGDLAIAIGAFALVQHLMCGFAAAERGGAR